jgi:hypothetical protein
MEVHPLAGGPDTKQKKLTPSGSKALSVTNRFKWGFHWRRGRRS